MDSRRETMGRSGGERCELFIGEFDEGVWEIGCVSYDL